MRFLQAPASVWLLQSSCDLSLGLGWDNLLLRTNRLAFGEASVEAEQMAISACAVAEQVAMSRSRAGVRQHAS